jgi:membrane-anchored glycerophosphoryl diester phosphodiesterase (GDPDase)
MNQTFVLIICSVFLAGISFILGILCFKEFFKTKKKAFLIASIILTFIVPAIFFYVAYRYYPRAALYYEGNKTKKMTGETAPYISPEELRRVLNKNLTIPNTNATYMAPTW